MIPLICAWINDCANNREAGDFRRHRTHFDVTVMGKPHVVGEFPSNRVSNAERVSIQWRHNVSLWWIITYVWPVIGCLYIFLPTPKRKCRRVDGICVTGCNEQHMMTPLNWNIFRVTGPLWAESIGHRWVPPTKASDAELWWFLWSSLNKRWVIQSRGWWFETPLCS